MRAKLGQVEALVQIAPQEAHDELIAFAKAHPSLVEASDYSFAAGKLASRRAFEQAARVMDHGLKAHPRHAKLLAVRDRLLELSKQPENSEALRALESLGYVGGK